MVSVASFSRCPNTPARGDTYHVKMKLSDFDSPRQQHNQNYITSRWRGLADVLNSGLKLVVNYLFVLNTGSLAAALAYVAAKESTPALKTAIWFFFAGTISLTIRAAIDYYSSVSHFGKFLKNVEEYNSGKLDWEVFLDRDKRVEFWDYVLHILGWFAAIACIGGLFIGINAI